MDKGYTGPDSDTPEIFKLTPKKGLLTSVELNRNEELFWTFKAIMENF